MDYSINTLAKISGVTVRTLRFYDEIGLLKPAYTAESGYRYYQEPQVLILQQILFFRELGLALRQIQEILKRSDFDKLAALKEHKKVVDENIMRMKKLAITIDKTINHLEGISTMDANDMFDGFSDEQQKQYEQDLVIRYGQDTKMHIEQSHEATKKWTEKDWQASGKIFDALCKELVALLQKKHNPEDPEVQKVVQKHYEWIKTFWTPDRASYIGLGLGYTQQAWEARFKAYHPHLAEYIAQGIRIFAERELL